MGDYISQKKDVTVITNNMALAAHLSEYGIKVISTGGNVIEAPYMLGGDDAVRTVLKYNTDKKVNLNLKYNITDFSGVNAVISDYAFFRL